MQVWKRRAIILPRSCMSLVNHYGRDGLKLKLKLLSASSTSKKTVSPPFEFLSVRMVDVVLRKHHRHAVALNWKYHFLKPWHG